MMSSTNEDYQFAVTDYGKTGVKLLHVRRDTSTRHAISEYEVSTLLELNERKDYTCGDNSLVVPTDTQKNTVYAVAQKYGVGCPEDFAIVLARHFLSKYSHVVSARITVETVNGWQRIQQDGKEHNHAFVSTPQATRYSEVFIRRNGSPQVKSGLRGLRVLKTTQSAFYKFHRCEFTTLPDTNDRILSTVVQAEWEYSRSYGVNFDREWNVVKNLILSRFAGPANEGKMSPSVQLTMYEIERDVLSQIAQVERISMALPNVHYFDVDMSRFKGSGLVSDKSVYQPTDKPSGLIRATLERKNKAKL